MFRLSSALTHSTALFLYAAQKGLISEVRITGLGQVWRSEQLLQRATGGATEPAVFFNELQLNAHSIRDIISQKQSPAVAGRSRRSAPPQPAVRPSLCFLQWSSSLNLSTSSVTSHNPETAARQLREGGRSRALCPELSEVPGLRTALSTLPPVLSRYVPFHLCLPAGGSVGASRRCAGSAAGFGSAQPGVQPRELRGVTERWSEVAAQNS
ncbi:hypothetical protein AOLI_G00258830 [Acnodon oligacanthus]